MESIESSSKIPLTPKKLSAPSVDDTAPEKSGKLPVCVHTTPKKPVNQSVAVIGTALELETPEKFDSLPRVQNPGVLQSGIDVKKKSLSFPREELDESDTDSSGDELEDEKRSGVGGSLRDEASVNLPEKYEMLCQFFCTMSSLIRLIRMRKMSPTLTNIIPRLERLTGRRITITDLSQLKRILPKAIVVKRILIRDEITECMKEDLHITIDLDALKSDEDDRDLKTIVRARIEDYMKSHSEEEEDVWEVAALLSDKENKLSVVDAKSSNPDPLPASHSLHLNRASFCRKASLLGGGGKVVEDTQLIPAEQGD